MNIQEQASHRRRAIWSVALVAMLALTALISASSAQAVWKVNGVPYTGTGQGFYGEGTWSITLKRPGGATTEIVGCKESTLGNKINGPYGAEANITLSACSIVGGPSCTVKPITIKLTGTMEKLTSESFKLVSTGECLYPEIPMKVTLYPTFGTGGKTLAVSMSGVDSFKILGTWTFSGSSTWRFNGEHINDTFEVGLPTYSWKQNFGSSGTGNGQFGSELGGIVAVSGESLRVADTNNNRIQAFTTGGTYTSQFGTFGIGNGQFKNPGGIAKDANGNLYVADTVNNRVQVFDSAGNYLRQFGVTGSGEGQFNYPYGIAVDPASERVFVTDAVLNRVEVFTQGGEFVRQFGSTGSGNGQFNTAAGIAVDRFGNLLVADYNNCRIEELSPTGSYLGQFGTCGIEDGQFKLPFGVTTDPEGNVWVSDFQSRRIQVFSANHEFRQKFGATGTASEKLAVGVFGISLNSAGSLFIADGGSHRISRWGF
jgi:streptogramin lyase